MLEKFLKEINELKEYKKKYEHAVADKKTMSDVLYEYMLKEYNSMTTEERISVYKEENCRCCRYRDCDCDIPDDVTKPIPSDKGWIPARKSCGSFEWS